MLRGPYAIVECCVRPSSSHTRSVMGAQLIFLTYFLIFCIGFFFGFSLVSPSVFKLVLFFLEQTLVLHDESQPCFNAFLVGEFQSKLHPIPLLSHTFHVMKFYSSES